MKKKIALLAIILCIASTLTAFSRGNNHGQYGDYSKRHNGYNNRPYIYQGGRGGRYHNDGLEFAIGVAGGLFLGSELRYSATRPRRQTVIYGAPYLTNQPKIIVKQSTACLEERITKGQSLIKQNDGSRVWSSSRYPIIQRVEVPCN